MRLANREHRLSSGLAAAAMPIIGILSLLSLMIFSPSTASAEVFVYGCVLSGQQEAPATTSAGLGGGQFRIDTSTNTVSYRISVAGLMGAETAAHIHGPALENVNGGVLEALPLGDWKAGTWNYADTIEADILAGKTYVNVHSTMFPGGEVRGQIVPLNAVLDEAQEVPPTGSTGTGWATFKIETGANKLHYTIVYSGLVGAETSAHIHGTGRIGVNGGVLTALPAASPKLGTWDYPEAVEADILAGNTYINIHTTAFPGGEIRGQIMPTVIPLDRNQEVPPTGSTGAGYALLGIDKAIDALSYDVRYTGLASETASHIHGYAPAGANAGVLTALAVGPRKLGSWAYPAGDEANIMAGLTYINIHTTAFPGGEIRGQLYLFDYPPTAGAPDPTAKPVFAVSDNYPNPFNTSTTLRFQLAQSADTNVRIFDSQGRLVKTLYSGSLPAGENRLNWDGRNSLGEKVPSGIYHYLLESPGNNATGRVTIVR